MWWSRRQALRFVLVPLALAGCGFEPMYGGRRGRRMAAALAAIKIEQIEGRVGQVLRNDLLDRLTPAGEPAHPRYRLRVAVVQKDTPLAIQSDATITRFNLRLDVDFTLINNATGKTLYRDRARIVGSYNAVRSDFANLSAAQDTARRAALAASEQLSTLLNVFFSRRASTSG